MNQKLRCQQVRAWNCRRVAIGYWNSTPICKGCLESKRRYAIEYPNGNYDKGTFTPFNEVKA